LNREGRLATLEGIVPTPMRRPSGEGERARDSVVRELRVAASRDAEIVGELRGGTRAAAVALFDRHGKHVERLLYSVLGPERDAEDLLHEVFLRALQRIDRLEEPAKLRSWLTAITVYTAREHIRKRARWRWLSFVAELPETPMRPHVATEEVTEATRCTYEVLRAMAADERVIFSLRFIEGMEMAEIAVASDLSLSTAKRRLKDAETHFVARALRFPALRPWIEEGGRWAST
jgi:RNA polymerase sigma-70 factor, ECF subfamily